jgi:uncharacterized spore protein YtfJ
MSSTIPFEPVSTFFERNLNIRHVYGEPVHHGETTIIPVAKVAYGFGAGGGLRPRQVRAPAEDGRQEPGPEVRGGGGGGGARLSPIGALEIGPWGTRFIRYDELPRVLTAVAFGLVVGWVAARRRR